MATNGTQCAYMTATSNGVWQHNNPIDFSFPLIVIQITLVLVVTRTLAFIFKPLRQPRVIGEIIGGILLGPTALGRSQAYSADIFPPKSITVLNTFANTGLLFFLFMVGLELDLRALRKVGSQALSIAAAGMIVPFAAGAGVSVLIRNTLSPQVKFAPFLVFMGVAMSITAFPVLARILAERKLLTTDVGQMAMSAAAVNDVSAWILLALAVALSGSNTSGTVVVWVLLCGLAFVVVMFVAVKPFMTWVAQQSPENEPIKEIYVAITFALVLICGFTTDAIGIHLIFGGFVFGLVIPKEGSFAQGLIEKIEDFVSVLLLPLYFASSGLQTNVATIHGGNAWGLLVLVICVACFGKIGGTFIVSQFFSNNLRKSAALGVLMNTKGLVELIVLNIGKERGDVLTGSKLWLAAPFLLGSFKTMTGKAISYMFNVLTDEVFAIMVLMAIFTTCITTPLVMAIYKPARNHVPYTRRRLYQDASPEKQLRILSCVHGIRNMPAVVNLTETVRGETGAIRLYILHLMELSERSSAIVMVQRARRDGRPFWDESGARTDRIIVGFEAFEQLSKVTVRSMTAISEFENMHEDICVTAEDKRAAMIILPFHKQVRLDGGFEPGHSGFRIVNKKVLQYSPCSVGILIDRGLWGANQVAPGKVDHTAVVLFFGGPDDREALAFGVRMSEHPGVKLKVIRYTGDLDLDEGVEIPDPTYVPRQPSGRSGPTSSRYYFSAREADPGLERQRDEEHLDKIKSSNGDKTISFEEVEIANLSETIMEVSQDIKYDLILVGRSSRPSPLLATLCVNRKHPSHSELGPVGDLLSSASSRSSILVVQQYDPTHKNRSFSHIPKPERDAAHPPGSAIVEPITGPDSPV